MPRYPFLDYKLTLYEQHLDAWKREERRLAGGDAVLEELRQWKGETDTDFGVRQGTAGYITIPKNHTLTLTGHLGGQTPMPEFGELGEVRDRNKLDGNRSLAELLWYNVDGIGQDGSEFMAWFDAVEERALATGYRWVMVEKPTAETLAAIRSQNGRQPQDQLRGDEIERGFRPFAVEYSPISVPFWQHTNGRLDFAVIRIPIVPANLLDPMGHIAASSDGYYLLVRDGFQGLGAPWSEGGWWKFDGNQDQVGRGTWEDTKGEIPLFQFMGEPFTGTTERPSLARSLTMELGQIAVGLMLLRSARDYNIIEAAKSVNHVLGIDPDSHGKVIPQQEAGSISVGYPPVLTQTGEIAIPTIWNSSAALLDSQAFESVIHSSLEEAREIMVKQVTSTPDSSGRSKEAGFAEATSPLLSRLAATRQQAINTFLYFASLRFGIQNPRAVVTIPREFKLQPVVDDIDAMLSTLKRSWLRSPTWETHLVLAAGDERGLIPDDKRAKIEAELTESGTIPTEPMSPLEEDQPEIPGRRPVKAEEEAA